MKILNWLIWWRRKPTMKPQNVPLPEWLANKLRPMSYSDLSSLSDLGRSVCAAVNALSTGNGKIVLAVPEDNKEVMDALTKAGGEIQITIRCAPRPVLELLNQEAAELGNINTGHMVKIPSLDGTFFS